MAKFFTWAVLAAGIWAFGMGRSHAGNNPTPPAKDVAVKTASLGIPTPVEESDEELVTPPLTAGCGACAPACRPHRLCDWLTYRSSRPGLCHCCREYAPCCQAPLYAYFPCPGCAATATAASPGLSLRCFAQRLTHPRCWGAGLRELGERLRFKSATPCETEGAPETP